ncbi:MAG TPA: hypothetical protein VG756_13090 [Pseudonocardiaceae bacterium]|jgi:hypothetical protein|nr:hypothetical protein [Pseudonocardiaceae bacterium]
MVARVLGSLVAGVAVVLAVAGCQKMVTGSAVPTTGTGGSTASGSSGGSGGPSSGGTTGAPAGNPSADQICGAVPSNAVEQLFSVTGVQTTVSSTTTEQGIYQVQCRIAGAPSLTINLVFAAAGSPYTPTTALAAIEKQQGIANVQPLTGVGSAQVAAQYTWQTGGNKLYAVSAAKQVNGTTHVYTLYTDQAAEPHGNTPLVNLEKTLLT